MIVAGDYLFKVTDSVFHSDERLTTICDFSPPRDLNKPIADEASTLGADFVSIAYSPGKSVRVDSLVAAYEISQNANQEVIFTVSTRDMNKLAIQNYMLGAARLGIHNVLIVRGDKFMDDEPSMTKNVNDYNTPGLVAALKAMNCGVDYRGYSMPSTTDFCIGSSISVSNDLVKQAKLTYRKVQSGVDFFVTEPVYELTKFANFMIEYEKLNGQTIDAPIFVGLQVPNLEGPIFGAMPESIRMDLVKGREGIDVALELLHEFIDNGVNKIYFIPRIGKYGRRDYAGATQFLADSKRMFIEG